MVEYQNQQSETIKFCVQILHRLYRDEFNYENLLELVMDGDIIYGDSTFEIGFIGNSIINSLVNQELRSNNNMIL